MTDIRMLVSWGAGVKQTKDWMSNTLYFSEDNVGTEPDYAALATDVLAVYQAFPGTSGSRIEVRAYNLADATPRPEKAFVSAQKSGARPTGPPQIALCLSYYADRNLPRQRGRVYLGPFSTSAPRPDAVQMQNVLTMATGFADVGGANVDWSVYSPTTAASGGDGTMSITDAWVDDSWDVIRSRKLDPTGRIAVEVNE